MHISTLQALSMRGINDALLRAFKGYFVQLPDDVEYWTGRMRAARYRPELSFGCWEGEEMMGFILQGIDTYHGVKTAFNTGTGVFEEYRGQGIVDRIYGHALPLLKAAGVEQCALEVIVDNHRAIRVYERIGFKIARRVCCFRGELPTVGAGLTKQEVPYNGVAGVTVREASFADIAALPGRELDDWENCNEGIAAVQDLLRICVVEWEGSTVGHFAINPKSGLLSRAEVVDPEDKEAWKHLVHGAAMVSQNLVGESKDKALVRMNNVDISRTDLRHGFLAAGMTNPVDQFEMVMGL